MDDGQRRDAAARPIPRESAIFAVEDDPGRSSRYGGAAAGPRDSGSRPPSPGAPARRVWEAGIRASGALLRADLGADRALTALAVHNLIDHGLRVAVFPGVRCSAFSPRTRFPRTRANPFGELNFSGFTSASAISMAKKSETRDAGCPRPPRALNGRLLDLTIS